MKKITGIISKILILLVVPMAFGLTGCSASQPAIVEEEKYIPVEVQEAGKKMLINTATLSGTVSSNTDVSVIPKIPGKVESVNVKVGDLVKKDTVLFTLESSDMKDTFQLANARYQNSRELWAAAKASLDRTKVLAADKIAEAKQNLANSKALFAVGAISKNQLDQTELAVKELESTFAGQIEQLTVQASDSTLKLAEVQFTQAQEALDNAVVTVPVDGIVSQVNVSIGNMVSTVQAAMSLTNTNNLYISLGVAENLVNRLTTGNPVKVTVPSVSAGSVEGKIEYISPSADSKTQLYPVKIVLENPEGLIKPGMFVKVELTTEEKPDVMAIKSEAIVLKNEKTIVYVVQDNKAVAKEVITGLDTGAEIEILQGLEQGNRVIIKGQTLVDEGCKVKIIGGEES